MHAPSSSTIALLVMLPLIVWRMYARIRRVIGRQRLTRARPWVTVIIYSLVVILLTVAVSSQSASLGLLAAGLTIGAGLGLYGLRRTNFENTAEGLFYTPNAHLGIALSLLFVGRIFYRMIQISMLDATAYRGSNADFARSPATLAVFGLLAGYYIAYAIGLMRWRKSQPIAANSQP